MLTHQQKEILLEIKRNPKNINIDSKVSIAMIKSLINNEYVTKSKVFTSKDGQNIFDYIVTDKGLKEMNNIEM